MLPPEPDTTPTPASEPGAAWSWRLEDSAGATVDVEGFGAERFTSQAEAESWVGEVFAELAEAGVDAVSLFEHDRMVYGPMSLHA